MFHFFVFLALRITNMWSILGKFAYQVFYMTIATSDASDALVGASRSYRLPRHAPAGEGREEEVGQRGINRGEEEGLEEVDEQP
jgi:hypothetical protein